MLTSKEIREVGFSRAVGGYRQDEVDNLLDRVEDDYARFESEIAELKNQNEQLKAEVESYKNSQSSLQNILIEAQKLADKTVNEAKEKAAIIISEAKSAAENAAGEAKNMLETFDAKFSEKRAEAEKELEIKLAASRKKYAAVEAATADAVKRQQALFDKTRIEIAGFKSEITELYKKHIELINKMPDCVAMDAERAAEAVTLIAEKEPDVSAFIPNAEATEDPESEKTENIVSQTAKGFTFNDDYAYNLSDEAADDGKAFSNGFFRK